MRHTAAATTTSGKETKKGVPRSGPTKVGALFRTVRAVEETTETQRWAVASHLIGCVGSVRKTPVSAYARWCLISLPKVRNYSSPVSELLTFGDCRDFRGWPDYPGLVGLGPEHVSELIRMATD